MATTRPIRPGRTAETATSRPVTPPATGRTRTESRRGSRTGRPGGSGVEATTMTPSTTIEPNDRRRPPTHRTRRSGNGRFDHVRCGPRFPALTAHRNIDIIYLIYIYLYKSAPHWKRNTVPEEAAPPPHDLQLGLPPCRPRSVRAAPATGPAGGEPGGDPPEREAHSIPGTTGPPPTRPARGRAGRNVVPLHRVAEGPERRPPRSPAPTGGCTGHSRENGPARLP